MGEVIELTQPDTGPLTPILHRYRGSLMNYEQLQTVPNPSFLIKDILLERSVNVVWGPSGAAKSFLTVDWGLSIATGKADWFEHEVKPGKVLYIMGEGKAGMKARVNAWVTKHRRVPEDDQIIFMGQMVDLIDPLTAEATLQVVGEVRPQLIIVDTLARSFTGHNENDTTDMGRFVATAEEIRDRYDTSLLLVHHPNSNAMPKMRGNGALKGAIDGEFELEPFDPEDTYSERMLYCRKLKDAPRFDPIKIHLKPQGDSLVMITGQYDPPRVL